MSGEGTPGQLPYEMLRDTTWPNRKIAQSRWGQITRHSNVPMAHDVGVDMRLASVRLRKGGRSSEVARERACD